MLSEQLLRHHKVPNSGATLVLEAVLRVMIGLLIPMECLSEVTQSRGPLLLIKDPLMDFAFVSILS